METVRIQTGATERITAVALSSALAPLTGLTDLLISIQRVSDGFWFDFADLTFKSVGWTTRQQAMTEISSTLAPGQYRYDFVTSTITNASANDAYLVTVTQSPGTTVKNIPQVGELKVGQYVDNINATVSSRSTLTQAQILSDTTPFQGARIDAAISSRAAPGAAMALTPAERTTAAGVVWDEALPGVHAANTAGERLATTDDRVDAAVSTRATPADVLTQLGVYGAATGAQVATRAAPGDAMDLVTDAVDAAALATSAITELDAALSVTHGAGSWEGGTPAAIADAVWDEAKAGHVAGGSFGEEVQSHATQAEILSDATPFQGARIDAAISSRAAPGAAMDLITDAVDANSLAVSAVAEIEAGLAALHGAGSWEGGTPAAIADAVWDEAIAGHSGAGSAGLELQNKPTAAEVDVQLSGVHGAGSWEGSSAGAVADAVWDELKVGHVAGGSFGEEVQSHATPAEVTAQLTTYGAATGGQVATRAAPGDAMDLVSDAVDSAALAASAIAEIEAGLAAIHGAGSWEGGGTAAAIADAVWDEAKVGHIAMGSFGEEVQSHATPTEVLAQVGAGLAAYPAATSAQVASRAAPGDLMTLAANAVNAASLAASATAEIEASLAAIHGTGSWEGSAGAAAIATAVWDEALPGAHPPGSAGVQLPARAVPGDAMTLTAGERSSVAQRTWQEAVPAAYGAGQAGKVLGDNLDAPVSTRAVPGDAMALTSGERAAVAGKVWDEAVPGAHLPGSAAAVLSGIDADVDAPVSSRAAPGAAMTLTTGERAAVAGGVWDEALPGTHIAGSAGRLLADLEARLTLARAAYLDQIPGLSTDTSLLKKIPKNRLELSEAGGGTWILYDDDDVTPLLTWPVRDKDGDPIRMNKYVPARRGRGT